MDRHVLAIYRATGAGERAVQEASAIAAEHGAQLTIATMTANRGGRGCCGVSAERWQDIVREQALAEVG